MRWEEEGEGGDDEKSNFWDSNPLVLPTTAPTQRRMVEAAEARQGSRSIGGERSKVPRTFRVRSHPRHLPYKVDHDLD